MRRAEAEVHSRAAPLARGARADAVAPQAIWAAWITEKRALEVRAAEREEATRRAAALVRWHARVCAFYLI